MTDEAPPSKLRRTLFVAVVTVALLFMGRTGFQKLAALAEDSERSDTPALPAMVRTHVAERTAYTETLRGYGRAKAVRTTTVAAELAGYVAYVAPTLEAGQAYDFEMPKPTNGSGSAERLRARPGPLVVKLEAYGFEDLVRRAEADRAVLDADAARLQAAVTTIDERIKLATDELQTAKRERDRVERLVRDGRRLAPSDLDREELKVMLREQAIKQLILTKTENAQQQLVLKKRMDAADVGVAIAQRDLRLASIHIPIPGVIETRSVNQGDRVAPGQALFTVLDLSQVEVPIALPASYYADVETGAKVTLLDVESNAVVHKGTVARKAPRIDEKERTFFVYVVVQGTPTSNPVAPGTFLRAELAGRTHQDVVVVPREAFAGKGLFVITPDPEADAGTTPRRGIAKRITPTVSRWLVDVAIVTAGLETGTEFVTSNLEAVANQTKLRIAPPIKPGSKEPAR